jgi:hypothetical protein
MVLGEGMGVFWDKGVVNKPSRSKGQPEESGEHESQARGSDLDSVKIDIGVKKKKNKMGQ